MNRKIEPAPLPERDAKRLRLWVWLVLLLGIVSAFAGLNRFYDQHNPKPTRAHIHSTDHRNVIVHDIGFRIPKSYFHPQAVKPNNSTTTTMLLSVELPDIGPQKLPAVDYFRMEGPHKLTRILIESPFDPDGTARLDIGQRLATFSKEYKTTERREDQHGLHYLARPPDVKMDRDEILYEGQRGNPVTLLLCMELPTFVPYPACKMLFNYKTILIEVSFRRADWLPQWREIKEATIARLDEFHTAYLISQETEQQEHLMKGIAHADTDPTRAE